MAAKVDPPSAEPVVEKAATPEKPAKPRTKVVTEKIAGAKVVERVPVDDADVAKFRECQPTARVEYVEKAVHSIQGDQPVVLAQLIKDFVEGASS